MGDILSVERGDREPGAGHPEAGISIVETLISLVLLLGGFLVLAQLTLTSEGLKSTTDEDRRIHDMIRKIGEEVRVVAMDARAQSSWSSAVISAFAATGSHGNQFAIAGLTPPAGKSAVGTIDVIIDERVTDAALGVVVGLPLDLDGDGAKTTDDVSGVAEILPVVISVEWATASGTRRLSRTMLVSRV